MLLRRDVQLSRKEAPPEHCRKPAGNTAALPRKTPLRYGTASNCSSVCCFCRTCNASWYGSRLDCCCAPSMVEQQQNAYFCQLNSFLAESAPDFGYLNQSKPRYVRSSLIFYRLKPNPWFCSRRDQRLLNAARMEVEKCAVVRSLAKQKEHLQKMLARQERELDAMKQTKVRGGV